MTIVVGVALTVIILISVSLFVLPQHQSLAQEQKQQELSLTNRTAFDTNKPIEDLSFEIDNITSYSVC